MMQPRDPLFTVLGSTELERDIALVDRVKEKFGIKSEGALADFIGMNKSVLADVRSHAKAEAISRALAKEKGLEPQPAGKVRTLTALQRLRCFNHLGYAWAREALIAAFPEAVRAELLDCDNERTRANVAAGNVGEEPA